MREFILVKPDGVKRGLVGEIIKRFENFGFKMVALKVLSVDGERAGRLYSVHEGKDFYDALIDYITSGPVVACVLEIGEDEADCVALVRKIVGATNPAEAQMGTIRGDFGVSIRQNIIHASDSRESRDKELPLFFTDEELVSYNKSK